PLLSPVDPLAVAALVLAITGPFTAGVGSIVSLVFGVVSLRRIRAYGGRLGGRSHALAGAVISGALLGVAAVVSVISLALWVPRSRQEQCLSNVKQLGLGTMMYCADYDERFPLGSTWCDGLQPYVRSLELYRCPAASSHERAKMDSFAGGPIGTYALNLDLAETSAAVWDYPAETEMLLESGIGWNQLAGPGMVGAVPRHRGGAHVCYADGHCKWCRVSSAPPAPEGKMLDEGTRPLEWTGDPALPEGGYEPGAAPMGSGSEESAPTK
ncbi:MAG: DUF4190 domain-containing protein, partial [Armatimonadetes bacterium]|nr:DUF4190 domain-containing protein [Armatimonadota bacterium]